MDYLAIHDKYFPSSDLNYMRECLIKLETGNSSGMFKFLVDDSFDVALAMKLVGVYMIKNKLPPNDIMSREFLDSIEF